MSKVNYAKLAKRRQSLKSGNLPNRWKLSGNKAKIRIIPFEHDGEEEIFSESARHFGVLPNVKVVPCLGDECPICELKDEIPDDVWDNIRPSRRCATVILDRDAKSHKPVIYDCPTSVMSSILEVAEQQNDEGIDIFDLEKGFDFIISKTGSGIHTRYTVQPALRPSKAVVDGTIPDLIAMEEKAVESMLSNIDLDDVAAGILDGASPKPKRTRSRKKK